ncbi:MAG: YqhA family protein [Burkholderiales bacterium]|nr:YqhA family protein [Burkholderiales bacterium]
MKKLSEDKEASGDAPEAQLPPGKSPGQQLDARKASREQQSREGSRARGAGRELPKDEPWQPLAHIIGRSRYVVLLASLAVMLVAISLFLLGTYLAVVNTWEAWVNVIDGNVDSTELTVVFLEIVSVMLKAVVFYIVGIGFYSLFIAPLNLPVSLGVETLNDLETKVISVVIVIMAVTFLEHFILWEDALAMLQHGATLALVVAALVLFQFYNHRAKEDQADRDAPSQAKHELFDHDHEEQEEQRQQ